MNNSCEENRLTLKQLEKRFCKFEEQTEKRFCKLEKQRDFDLEKIQENNKNLAVIVVELKNITKTMDNLASRWEEANKRMTEEQKEYIESFESRLSALEKKLDERTIIKNSNNYDNIKKKIVEGIIASILGFLAGIILKG